MECPRTMAAEEKRQIDVNSNIHSISLKDGPEATDVAATTAVNPCVNPTAETSCSSLPISGSLLHTLNLPFHPIPVKIYSLPIPNPNLSSI